MTTPHGLFANCPPPSRERLYEWFVQHSVQVSDDVEVFESELGGWGVRAKRDLEIGELRE